MNSTRNSAPDHPDSETGIYPPDLQKTGAGERVHLREFQYPEDYRAARLLWENAGPGIHIRRSDEPEEIQKKLQRDPDLFMVAEIQGRLVGTVIGGFDGRRGLIYHLAVDAAFRQQGVGSLLMDEVERRLRAKGCLKCYLMVTVDNDNALRFYETRRWERMDSIHTYTKEL
jgi:ribosomal protein S18 acetylase RimI-like enzyme